MKIFAFSCLFILILLSSCDVLQPVETAPVEPLPTPTSNLLFADQDQAILLVGVKTPSGQGAPTVASFFEPFLTNTPNPTSLSGTATEEPPLQSSRVVENEPIVIPVFDDELNPNWRTVQSQRTKIDTDSREFVHSGDRAISIEFDEDFGTAYFAIVPDTAEIYRRDNVLAVSFWLNGGKDAIATDELGITVFGSNDFQYWVAGDNSVSNVVDPVFLETRLYYLGVNRTIPPDTWVRIEVWLDDLVYDPLYDFFTGFFIKNDEGFHSTIYIDDVTILVVEDILRIPSPSETATQSAQSTTDSTSVVEETVTIEGTEVSSPNPDLGNTQELPVPILTPSPSLTPTLGVK